MNKRTFLAAACSAVAVAALPAANAYAQATYPDKPIRVIMPWAAGGPTDVVGRVIAVQMGEILGQPLVIETRAGASGTIGTAQVAKAPADGYTLLMNPSVQGIYPAQFKNLSFDPIKDFKMVGVLGTVPMVAVVPPDSKFESFGDLIKQAQAQPGSLSFASPGVATLPHLAGELINTSTKTKITHVGYRGSSPALTDVAGGHVDLMYAPPPGAGPAAHPERQGAPDRRHDQDAPGRTAQRADYRGNRAARVRHRHLVRHVGAERHPGTGHRQAQQGHDRSLAVAQGGRSPEVARHAAQRHELPGSRSLQP